MILTPVNKTTEADTEALLYDSNKELKKYTPKVGDIRAVAETGLYFQKSENGWDPINLEKLNPENIKKLTLYRYTWRMGPMIRQTDWTNADSVDKFYKHGSIFARWGAKNAQILKIESKVISIMEPNAAV